MNAFIIINLHTKVKELKDYSFSLYSFINFFSLSFGLIRFQNRERYLKMVFDKISFNFIYLKTIDTFLISRFYLSPYIVPV